MSVKEIQKTIETMMAPLLAEGYELWHVEFAKEGSGRQLRVYVDRPEGIDMDGCEKVSRFLSDRLDEADPIGEPYDLIVSSPGMDRVLRKDEHFARYIGRPAEISLYRGIDGRRKFAALLGEKTEDTLTVTPIDAGTLAPDGAEMHIPLSIISKVNLLVVW